MSRRFDPDDPAVLVLDVAGLPVTKGSLVPIKLRKGARAGETVIVEQTRAKLTPWLRAIKTAGKTLAADRLPDGPIDGPVAMMLVFRLPRPKARRGPWRAWPVGRGAGDVDKLARAILDGLTGSVIGDDSQVTDLMALKRYWPPDQQGCEVRIRPLGR